MTSHICTTCGVAYGESEAPPDVCLICEDERQYVNWHGQQWTTLGELRHDYANAIRPEGQGITGIGTEPAFAIGQRALLVESPAGNLLWDCISLIDSATVAAVQDRGGPLRHRHLPSALLCLHDRMEPRLRRRADLPPRGRQKVGHAPRPGAGLLERRNAHAWARASR